MSDQPEEVRIRWRRYGRGGRWRADLPPHHGMDSGWIESPSLDLVRGLVFELADRNGWPIIEEPKP